MRGTNNSSGLPKAPSDLAPFIDHTLLRADATPAEIERLCDEALRFGFKGVCVNSTFVEAVSRRLNGSATLAVSVVGFPLGAMLSSAKAFETELAVRAGAREIDTVLSLGAFKAGDFSRAEEDIASVVRAAGADVPVKVIIETGLLNANEIADACRLSESAGAAFVKTATGFLARGATVEDIRVMRNSLSPHMKIKASGGIKTFAQARDLILAGAVRLGTSSGVSLVSGAESGPTSGSSY